MSDSPQAFVGKKVNAVILEINRSLHKIIFSQKAALNDQEFAKFTEGIKPGDVVDAVVSNSAAFGVFVSFKNKSNDQTLEGFIHLSELSWDKVESAENIYKAGEKITAKVIGVDKEAKRINLSIKKLTQDPFEEASREFKVDSKVKGTVKQISSLGILIDLGEIEGLIKKEKVPPTATYKTGDELELTVSDIDSRRHRIILTPVLKEKPMGYR